jgi:quinol monooxygenase YgiN
MESSCPWRLHESCSSHKKIRATVDGLEGSSPVIVFSVRIIVDHARRSALIATLLPLLEPTRVMPGCQDCRLYSDFEDANAFCIIGEWSDAEDLGRYLRSQAYRVLLGAIEMGACLPEVRFDTVNSRVGIEAFGMAREL